MIIHRDYTSTYNSVIKIFADHIQFYNPGKLPDSISIEQLRTNDYVSKPRNRQIAKTVKEMGWIERYGTGIKRVRRMCIEHGLSEPVFKEESDGMLVTVFGLLFDENMQKFVDKENDASAATGGQIGGQIENVLTDRQKEILNILEENPYINRDLLSKKLQINQSATFKHLDSLKRKGIIERIGKTKGYWKIIEKQ